jgi:hypothetical protein
VQTQGEPVPLAVHDCPGPQLPKHAGKTPPQGRRVVEVVVVDVELVVEVEVDVEVEVVDVEGHEWQQVPVSAVPPAVSQRVADRLIRQRSPPPCIGIRHADSSEFPQVDRAAHPTAACLQTLGRLFRRTSPFAVRDTHWTWLRWLVAALHGHAAAIWSATLQRAAWQSTAGPGLPMGPRARTAHTPASTKTSAVRTANRLAGRIGRMRNAGASSDTGNARGAPGRYARVIR